MPFTSDHVVEVSESLDRMPVVHHSSPTVRMHTVDVTVTAADTVIVTTAVVLLFLMLQPVLLLLLL